MHASLVLVPVDLKMQIMLQDLAQHYSSISLGYILGPESLPHISVIQVKGLDEEQSNTLKTIFTKDINIQIRLNGFHYKRLPLEDSVIAAELKVELSNELKSYHEQARNCITLAGFEPCNKVGADYSPHLTLAHLRSPVTSPPISDYSELFDRSLLFSAHWGNNDSLWQLSSSDPLKRTSIDLSI